MYDINTLKGLNEAAYFRHRREQTGQRGPTETETLRHCSFLQSKRGIVLHSAKRRSTLFLGGATNVKRFLLAYASKNSVDAQDKLIESYFN